MSNIAHFNQTGLAQPYILAADNGGTNTRLQLWHGDQLLGHESYPTPHNYDTAINQIGQTAEKLAEGQSIDGVGFAVAGKVEDGMIVSAGELQEFGWTKKTFCADVAVNCGVEEARVSLLNDCVAAAKSQQHHNREIGSDQIGYLLTISTGIGGSGFKGAELIEDEPGHKFYKAGAICGCGRDGCVEAHISGSGIKRKYLVSAENLPADRWKQVTDDMVEAHVQMLERLKNAGLEPKTLYYMGSVALKTGIVLPALSEGLLQNKPRLVRVPNIAIATYGDNSGLVGARFAAREVAEAA